LAPIASCIERGERAISQSSLFRRVWLNALYQTSVPEWDRHFRLVRVHHEHCEEFGRLRLAGIGAYALAVTDLAADDSLGYASSTLRTDFELY
jgi:hypothetical protein